MAKRPKASTVNVKFLQAIADGEASNNFARVTEAEHAQYKDLIEVNPTDIVEGKAASRLSDAGKEYLANAAKASTGGNSGKPMYEVMKGIPIPESKRGNRKGAGAPTIYPFETMQVNDSFFVWDEDKPEAAKKLGSTVSQQNMKYRTPTGATEKRDVLNRKTKVKELKDVALYTQDRKYVLRSVKQGDKLGDYVVPKNGAFIAREA